MSIRVITNNIPRDTVDACELTPAEREAFDYLDWPAIDDGRDSATFVRYKGELLDLGNFMADSSITRGAGLPDHLSAWHGYAADSAFSATVIRLVADDQVVIGRVLT
jgi:hypothetical protein